MLVGNRAYSGGAIYTSESKVDIHSTSQSLLMANNTTGLDVYLNRSKATKKVEGSLLTIHLLHLKEQFTSLKMKLIMVVVCT